jgi:adenine-specific DNA-methyltransferase
VKYRQLYRAKDVSEAIAGMYQAVELPTGERRRLSPEERRSPGLLPEGTRFFRYDNLTSAGWSETLSQPVVFDGREFRLSRNLHWKTTPEGLGRLAERQRLAAVGNSLGYVRFFDDFPVSPMQNLWIDTATGGFGDEKLYVVQTVAKVIQRCLQMTTDPGDLVLDPTCGSGTTAYVAEQSGRRWITIDTSRVPLALARQRLLTATFPYYQLQDPSRGPAGGFVYRRKQNAKGE